VAARVVEGFGEAWRRAAATAVVTAPRTTYGGDDTGSAAVRVAARVAETAAMW
jgi:hypothetical protein